MLMIFIIFYFIIAIVLSDGGTGTRDVGGDRFLASDWLGLRDPGFSLVDDETLVLLCGDARYNSHVPIVKHNNNTQFMLPLPIFYPFFDSFTSL